MTSGLREANTPIVSHYVGQYEKILHRLDENKCGEPDWYRDFRNNGLETLRNLGFPKPRDEDWKYTQLKSLLSHRFAFPTPLVINEQIKHKILALGIDQPYAVVINGQLVHELCCLENLDRSISVEMFNQSWTDSTQLLASSLPNIAQLQVTAFSSLNAALSENGILIRVAENSRCPTPLHLIVITDARSEIVSNPNVMVTANENSHLHLVEHHIGHGHESYLNNSVVNINLENNAHLHHYKIQDDNRNAYHVATLNARLGMGSHLVSHHFSCGGKLSRNGIKALFSDEQGYCEVNGLMLAKHRQHVDYHTDIDHASPSCISRELFKGIFNDSSRGVFNGRVVVQKDAQKSDSAQTNHNLLLSDESEIDTKPQLEIYADDVKCAHGATIGQLDESMLFYLRSRGLSRQHAKSMLIQGFAQDLVDRIDVASVRERCSELMARHLSSESE